MCIIRLEKGECASTRVMAENYEVIIIGGGPSGASAALYLARAGVSTLIMHNDSSALHKAESIQNFYGTGCVSGKDLYDSGIEEARRNGVSVVNAQATFCEYDGSSFTVSTSIGTFTSKRLIIATGTARKTLAVEGVSEFEGKGVSYCAVCDAFFYRKKTVGVIGGGEFAKHEYETLKMVANKVILFTNGEKQSFSADEVYTEKIEKIVGGERANGVVVGGSAIAVDGVFIALGVMGAGSIAKSMGVLTTADGAIATDENRRTNIDGLYAIGDCVSGVKQVSKAVFDGMTAALDIIRTIKEERRG